MKRILLLTTLFFTACTSSGDISENSKQVQNLNGTPATFDQLIEGKKVVVNFWAASCAFCKDELPHFEEIALHNSDVTVIAVNLQENQKIANRYWEEGGYTFPTLLDPGSALKSRYEVFTQPTTVFLDESGTVVSRKDGPLTKEELGEFVAALLTTPAAAEEPMQEEEPEESEQQSSLPPLLRSWYDAEVEHLIPLEELLGGGPAKDGIPSIDAPVFLPASEVRFLDPTDVGVFVTVDGDSRFYAYRLLNYHEIVNDTIGEVNVAVTYCPLCATAVAYERDISAGETTFGVSGLLYQSNLVMYDRVTESLWNQVTGQAVVGPLTGETLKRVRSDVMQFKTVQEKFPDAKVMTANTGVIRNYGVDPYEGYDSVEKVAFPVQATNASLPSKELVYGILVNGTARAYPASRLRERGTIEEWIGRSHLRLYYDSETEHVRARNLVTDEEILPIPIFWFSWVAQYPDTGVYRK